MEESIEQFDIVFINKGKYAGKRGFVQELVGDKATVYIYGADPADDVRQYALSTLTLVPPITLAANELRSLARFGDDIVEKMAAA